MLGRLIPVGGGSPLLLLREKMSVGRSASNDLPVSCGSVSGKHCELELIDGFWWVRDLGSRNGTAVDNVRCQRSRIAPGSILRLANQRFRIDYQAPKASIADDSAVSYLLAGDSKVELSFGSSASVSSSSFVAAESPPRQKPATELRPAYQNTGLFRALGKLVPLSGGDPLPLLESPLVVGRRSACDLALKFADVSSRHCTLTFEEGFWVVEDQQSTNGVRVNGERVERKVLFPDDRLSIASHRFIIHYVPQGSLPPSDGDTFSKGLLEKLGLKDSSLLVQQKLNEHTEHEDQPKRYTLE